MTLPNMTSLLSELIATPSISSADLALDVSNRPVIDMLAQWLSDLGFTIEIQELGNEFGNHKANLIATLGTGSGGLVLAGHTDTVPYDDALWSSDPFKLHNNNNCFYGLGTTDMKGFFAIAIEAIKAFQDQKLKQPLIILATADEESSMSGARALSKDQFNARYAVIGEPTGLKPVHMHKGIMMESISLQGQSGHSSNPALGKNALDAMYNIIGKLIELRNSWGKRYQNPAFEIDIPTLNLASIHGGDAPNRICQHCQLQFDVRLLPGMRNDEVRQSIKSCVNEALIATGITANIESIFGGVEAFLEPKDSELIKRVEQLTGHTAGNVGFATEAPFLQALGMQTVVMGPGSIDCAHQANEYLAHDQIKPAVALLKSLIQTYCL